MEPGDSRSYDQAAVIPWRMGAGGPEVLLISGRGPVLSGKKSWVIPQGDIEPGHSEPEAAAAEAWEEAGIEGRVDLEPFTDFTYETGSGHYRVAVFRMEVRWEAEDWPERAERLRRWIPWAEAAAAVSGAPIRRMLDSFRPPAG